ncbi:MAG: D-alanyl-D-alanine carboxypeptidase [Bdellovibrio sp.]
MNMNICLGLFIGAAMGMSSASAKVFVNSMCHMKASSDKQVIEGDKNKNKKYPLASISKVVTSLWAVEELGPEYRYKTKLHLKQVSENTYNIHIEGSRDPLFGRGSSYFIISELNRLGIKNIENLSFDENFLLEWQVEEGVRVAGDTPYYRTIDDQAEAIHRSLLRDFGTPIFKSAYNTLSKRAEKKGVRMAKNPFVSLKRVDFVPSQTFAKTPDMTTLVYQSAPLKTILKNMNNQSNNYIADHLYWNLGGTDAFKSFMKKALDVGPDEFEFHLGSGNNANYIYDPAKDIYNKATCETMIKVLFKLDKRLEKSGLELTDVMAVAGSDTDSTVAGFQGNFRGATIAKTGSVNRAKTLAGTVSTKTGDIYFTILVNTNGPREWGVAQNVIKNKLNFLMINNGGPRRFQYDEVITLPFDAKSVLQEETPAPVVAAAAQG